MNLNELYDENRQFMEEVWDAWDSKGRELQGNLQREVDVALSSAENRPASFQPAWPP